MILAEENSQAKILLTRTGKEKKAYISDDIRILAKKGSRLDFVSIQDLPKGNATMQKRTALVKKDAHVDWIDCVLGSVYTKSNNVNKLIEEGATGNIRVIFSGNDKQKYDLYTASEHKFKNTYSDIVTKGVLNNEAKCLSRGLVKIEENAFGSNGYEQQDVLLLSEESEGDAIPNLVIHNHDVKCSHGSTIGQIDKEKLFYLQSRGLDEDEAKKKIVEGYFTPIMDLFREPTKERIHKAIVASLENG